MRWCSQDSGIASFKCPHHNPDVILLDVHRLVVLARAHLEVMAAAQVAAGQAVVMAALVIAEVSLAGAVATVRQVVPVVANVAKVVALVGAVTPANGGRTLVGVQIHEMMAIAGRVSARVVVHRQRVDLLAQVFVGVVLVGPVQLVVVRVVRVRPGQVDREGRLEVRVVVVIDRSAEVNVAMTTVGHTVVMTTAEHEVAIVGRMIAVRVPATSGGVIPTGAAVAIETLVIPVVAEVRDQTAQSGRNVHEMVDARAGKSARLGNREMRRSAALRRCVHAVAVQLASGSTQQSAKSILISGSTRVQFVKRSSRPCSELDRFATITSSFRAKFEIGSTQQFRRRSVRRSCANDCSGPSFP